MVLARGRNCQSSNPESSAQPEINATIANSTESGVSDDNSSHRSQIESDDDSILFSTPQNSTMGDRNKPILKYNESWTSNAVLEASEDFKRDKRLNKLGEYPAFGTFVRWRDEPPLPSKYTSPIGMPSSDIQMHMIDLFFETRYKVAPMIPKRLFYEQLRIKGPLITPLLLNSIYCVVSGYSTLPDVPKPAVFYNRAKKLVDDFLDTPRISTVAALCLLALYEPVPTKSKNMPDQHCRSWMYSGMASRMCLELGLNIDTPRSRANKSPEEIEFSRRVFWSCYCLDKTQSVEWERLWSIPSSLARTAFPQVLPGDDDEERWIVMVYEEKIRLAIIGEEGLQIRASFSIRDDISEEKFHDQLEGHRSNLLKWRDNLKSPELWGLAHCDTIEQVINEPKKSPVMSYLHIIYYFMLVDSMFCLPDAYQRSLEHRIYASQLTKSIDVICDEPAMVIRYELLAHATIAALRVHARYINDSDSEVSSQSWSFFHLCVKILRRFQKHAIIPECSAVLTHLPALCQQHSRPPPSTNYNSSMIQALAPSATGPQGFSETENVYSQEKNINQVCQQQQVQQQHQMPLQEQALYNHRAIDPYRNDISSVPTYGYQSLDSLAVPGAPYSSLTAFGCTIGVDFSNRRQLWEYALQDVLNEPQQYDISSSATTPESTSTPLTYNNDWSSTSPRTTSEFIWPAAEAVHSPPPMQSNTEQLQPPSQLPQMISSPLQQDQQHIEHQQYQHQQFQQSQPPYTINSSSSPHPHQNQQNLDSMYAIYSQSINTNNHSYAQQQQPHHQIPSQFSYQNMQNNINNCGNLPPPHVYYPN